MKRKAAVPLLLLLLFPFTQQAQILHSLYPSKFFTQSEPTVLDLTITGEDMWPNYMTITMTIQLLHVHFKKNGRDEVIRGRGIASDRQTVEFISGDWLRTPGPVEVYITNDGMGGVAPYRSNSLFLQVEAAPSTAPVIKSLSNTSFKTADAKEKYYIRIYGSSFGEEKSTYASIGSYHAPAGWQQLTEGVMDVWVPAEVYNHPGDYPVVVTTKNGSSNAVMLKIEAPPATTISPAGNFRKNNMIQKPVQIITPSVASIQTVKTGGANMNEAIAFNRKMTSGMKLVSGITAVMTGSVKDGATRTSLENFIKEQEHVFIVDNQLQLTEGNTMIQVKLSSTGVDKAAVEQLKTQIENKASTLHVSVSVSQ